MASSYLCNSCDELWDPMGFTYYYNCYGCSPYAPSSSACHEETLSSSSSAVFDWAAAGDGFRDSFDIFIMVFAVFAIVKMLNMAAK
jgi:hypothetical protein